MNTLGRIISWLLGSFLLLISLISFIAGEFSPLLLTFFIVALMLIPPIRDLFYKTTKIKIPRIVKGVIIVILIIFGKIYQYEIKIEERKAEYFKQNSTQILEKVRNAFDRGDFDEVVSLSAKYQYQNQELYDLNTKARLEINKELFNLNSKEIINDVRNALAIGEYVEAIDLSSEYLLLGNQELIDLHDKAIKERTKQILSLLKHIPVSEYQKNRDLYQQLMIYNPDVAKYEKKLNFYTEKLKQQQQKIKLRLEEERLRLEEERLRLEEKQKRQIELYQRAQSNPEEFVEIVKQSWYKDGFGTIAVVNLTIKNTAPIDVKDIIVRCNFYANSGTKLDTKTKEIYEIIKSYSTRKFRDIELGFINSQASKGGCRVVFAKVH